MRINPNGAAFALFLGALAALPPISTDLALPALTAIGADFHARSGVAGLTLSLFMAGFAMSPFVYGPLSDRYGRRPLLIVGLALFLIGGIGATLAPSMSLLLLARLIQGMGAGAGMTLAMAMVRDLFHGRQAQSRLTVVTVVANTAPIVGPALGAALLNWVSWRGIYGVIALCGLVILLFVHYCLAETASLPERAHGGTPSLLRTVLRDYGTVACHAGTIAHILLNALGFGWMFAYVSGSPLVLIDVMHSGRGLYSAMFACTGAGIVCGAMLSGKLVHQGWSTRRVLYAAVAIAVLATLALWLLSIAHAISLAVFMPLLVISTAAFGLAAPCASQEALEALPKLAGIAGGLLTSVQMLAGALASCMVALLFPVYGATAMTATMLVFALAALVLCLFLSRVAPAVAAASAGRSAASPG